MSAQIITTKKPVIPPGFRKFKYSTGGFKPSIIGEVAQSENPVWAEARYDKNALFKEDRKFYRPWCHDCTPTECRKMQHLVVSKSLHFPVDNAATSVTLHDTTLTFMPNITTIIIGAAIVAVPTFVFLLMSGIGFRQSLKLLSGYVLGAILVFAFAFLS